MTDDTDEISLDEEDELATIKGQFRLDFSDDWNLVKIKCSQCDESTVHEWWRVEPSDTGDNVSALEAIKLHRRLIMCTECGNLSLKK